MPTKEAQARIKINKLLEEAGWRFFDDENGRANKNTFSAILSQNIVTGDSLMFS